jgi:hypothetical protein
MRITTPRKIQAPPLKAMTKMGSFQPSPIVPYFFSRSTILALNARPVGR